jgi:D-alanine-D-alanine ligase
VRVAVLGGGRSSEHEVSLASAASVRAGLMRAGHEPVALEPAGGLLGADVAFPALHGPFGEDGTIQGLLEVLDVPYVGAGVAASAVCMDKVVFKELMGRAGVAQVDFVALRRGEDPSALEHLGLPVFVKPARLGSSVGISKVSARAELPAALSAAFQHDPLVIVEAMARGLELECSVLGNSRPEPSEPGEIVAHAEWYDYQAKYRPGGMELRVPPRVSPAVRERVRRLAVEVFVEDPDDEDRVLVNELNTIPGFTETSVYAKLFEASGMEYSELLDRLLRLAIERYEAERSYRF